MKCLKGSKKLFGIFRVKNKHSFLISNAFYTLEDSTKIDVVKTCQECGVKEVFNVDRNTLMELVERFPNAFNSLLREYLKTWKI
jgi:hypothetical protein